MTDQPTPSAVPIAPQEAELRVDELLDAVHRALSFAFVGSAKDGSYLRGTGGQEYVPSVFMLMDRLRDAVAAARLPSEARPSPTEPKEVARKWHMAFNAAKRSLTGFHQEACSGPDCQYCLFAASVMTKSPRSAAS